jgi:23S rRNA-/tRNA-specific pseudouridylate synthase
MSSGTWSVPPGEVFGQVRVYPSVTSFRTLWQDERRALLLVWPVTGRRHQIRVHLAWIGYPIAGDPLFAATSAGDGTGGGRGTGAGVSAGETASEAARTHLHSWRLEFDAAWRSGARLRAEAAPGADFWAALPADPPAGAGRADWLASLLASARARCEERG